MKNYRIRYNGKGPIIEERKKTIFKEIKPVNVPDYLIAAADYIERFVKEYKLTDEGDKLEFRVSRKG